MYSNIRGEEHFFYKPLKLFLSPILMISGRASEQPSVARTRKISILTQHHLINLIQQIKQFGVEEKTKCQGVKTNQRLDKFIHCKRNFKKLTNCG